VLPPTEDD
jgi:hypothetical protein